MTTPENYKFHSTSQFRNVVKSIKTQAQYKGQYEEGNPIMDRNAVAPTLDYVGTTKLHGTNASIILHEDHTISFHSKSSLLGYLSPNTEEFTLISDNAEFAQSMSRRKSGVLTLIAEAIKACEKSYGEVIYPIKISGEWVGQGIQKGVGISYLPKKSLFVFGVKCGETYQNLKQGWLPLNQIVEVQSKEDNLYNITDYTVKHISIDFNNPEYIQNTLVEATEAVENCCPVTSSFGIQESLLGEGLVWVPLSPEYCYDNGNWFKTKGKKHSVSKVKSVASVCPEKIESIKDFVGFAATDNRLDQGITEVGLDQKLIGAYIVWVNRDINKEEGDTLEESNLTMKDVGKKISDKARQYYLGKLNSDF